MPEIKSIKDIIPPGRIIPVCTIDNPDRAVSLARTLQDCGIHVIEITLRTEGAFTAAKNVINECPEVCVGIGTVTSVEQLRRADAIGAQFCVSPGKTERLVNTAQQLEIPYLPGVSTVSEVMAARELGLNHLKFFPAEATGGVKTLGMFKELFPDIFFCPTGGINEDNHAEYLRQDNVFCIGGSWLAPPEKIESSDWMSIKESVRRASAKSIDQQESTPGDPTHG